MIGMPFTGSYIWLSTDSGNSFTTVGPSGQSFYKGAMSSNGNFMVVSAYLKIYVSSNTGSTWAQASLTGTVTGQFYGAASDAIGQNMYVAETGGYIWYTRNFGSTWTCNTSAGALNWWGLASSYNGCNLVGAVKNGYLWTSTNGGITWSCNTSTGTQPWSNVASDSTGSNLVAAAFNATNSIYISSNGGSTWVPTVYQPTLFPEDVAISANGFLIVVGGNTNLYITSNSGATAWASNAPIASKIWQGVAVTASGSTVLAATNPGYFWSNASYGGNPINYMYSTGSVSAGIAPLALTGTMNVSTGYYVNGVALSGGSAITGYSNSGAVLLATGTSNGLQGSSNLFFSNTSNLGIQTTTPATALDVNGGVTIRNGYRPLYSNVVTTPLTVAANSYGTHFNITTSTLAAITLPTITWSNDSNAYWVFRNNTGTYLSVTFTYTSAGTTAPTNPVTIPPANSVTVMLTYPGGTTSNYVLF
jgi:photosystem II stability/assembly factor-like uncharacterized protein